MQDTKDMNTEGKEVQVSPPGDELRRSMGLLHISSQPAPSDGESYAVGEGEPPHVQEDGAKMEVRDQDPASVKVDNEAKVEAIDNTAVGRSEIETPEVFPVEGEAHPCQFIDHMTFKHIISQLGKTRNIDIFYIFYRFDWKDEIKDNHAHGLLTLVQFLLTSAKNLVEFELSQEPIYTQQCHQQVTLCQKLSLIIAEGIPATVKLLKLEIEMDEEAFDNLGQMQPQLERFEFSVLGWCKLGSRTLHKFLKSQASTLKHLRIEKCCIDSIRNFFEFPRLDELIHLEFSHVIITNSAPSDFAKVFPKLQCLKIPNMNAKHAFLALLSSAKKPSETLKVLHFPEYINEPLAPLAKSFPYLTELHIYLLPKRLREVFTYLGNLQTLNVTLHYHIELTGSCECLFSGISESDCARIKVQDFQTANLNELQRGPSIFNLTILSKLSVANNHELDTFTDFSAHFIFLEMENLREIQLPRRITQFSPRYLDLLRGKLNLVLR